MTAALYKVTDLDGRPLHGGTGRWPLPQDGQPGRWRSVRGLLVPCQRGLHLVTLEQLPFWLGPVIWEAEAAGERIDEQDKIVVRRARLIRRVEAWTPQLARQFTAECTDRAIGHAATALKRAGLQEQAARLRELAPIIDGTTAREAWDAARTAAWDAVRAAGAAGAAAWGAGNAWAAGNAERQWQAERLAELLGLEQ